MRSDKDEIARLKAENIALQKRGFSAPVRAEPSMQPQAPKPDEKEQRIAALTEELKTAKTEIDSLKKAHSEEIARINADSAEAVKARNCLAEKVECINTLKIRNAELENQMAAMQERLNVAEAMAR